MPQTTGLKRDVKDKYYTNPKTVTTCMNIITKHLNIGNADVCIEPSAGNGAFIEKIKSITQNNIFYDIEPENDDIIKQDYLALDPKDISKKYKKIHVIGNPPFGRQSSLAIKFIKKSTEFCDSISFILPKSFKKDSLKKHFPLKFHLETEIEIPTNSFLINNKPHNVPCVFQIWIKKSTERTPPITFTPNNFKFVKKTEEHDISFRRVGVYAGELDTITENKSIQSHYFIKFHSILTEEQLNKLKNINYDNRNNTVGPRSISKPELIKEFNAVLDINSSP